MNYRYLATTVVLCMLSLGAWAQETPEGEGNEELSLETTGQVNLNLDGEEEEEEEPKKKKRRNEFYGLKTKPSYITRGQGNNMVRETFYYLKEYQEPDPFVQEVFWYDFRRKAIVNNRRFDAENSGILHGPYEKYIGEELVEKGMYYLGVKHGRWVTYDRKGILTDKRKYFKGWPKESRISYYDRDATKMEEVIPVEYGEENGDYYYFHENGLIAVTGQYKYGRKVGLWREYYSHRRQIKREIQYPADPWDWDQGFTPFILREYDKRGNLIYDREAYQRKITSR